MVKVTESRRGLVKLVPLVVPAPPTCYGHTHVSVCILSSTVPTVSLWEHCSPLLVGLVLFPFNFLQEPRSTVLPSSVSEVQNLCLDLALCGITGYTDHICFKCIVFCPQLEVTFYPASVFWGHSGSWKHKRYSMESSKCSIKLAD